MLKNIIFTFLLSMMMSVTSSSSNASDLNLERYFSGETVAVGSFSAINGIKRSFKVALSGKWNGKTLTLVEDFSYDDGIKERKTWRFNKISPTKYIGTREDVVGETLVTVTGNMAHFTYLVDLDNRNRVRFHDTMTLRPDGTLVNSAVVTKYGFPVALTKVEFKRR